jgi:putative hydrolase of the HAD superfamily
MTQKSRVVVFDLDDTLYKEQDYLLSAYREIAERIGDRVTRKQGVQEDRIFDQMLRWRQEGENVFQCLIDTYGLDMTVDDLLTVYRSHVPAIRLDEETKHLLDSLHWAAVIGLITDGRSLTQRHKIEALGLSAYMDEEDILISEETGFEKPSEVPYRHFMARYPACTYYYVGDNPAKDFSAPERLGWTSICLLDDGRNIHPQELAGVNGIWKVEHISGIENIII